MTDAGRLQDRVAVVTGADSGIGRAIAEAFARAGADLIIVYHSDDAGAGETLASVQRVGRRGVLRQLDVRDQRAVAELFDRPVEGLRVPFIVVNSAGVGGGGQPVAETEGAAWDRVIRTDLYGPFYCCRHFMQARKAEGG
ncbi:MAG: SDR family NAD(P)-dependent oxidoreductase, partial [Acetobacteraceae bacterium]